MHAGVVDSDRTSSNQTVEESVAGLKLKLMLRLGNRISKFDLASGGPI